MRDTYVPNLKVPGRKKPSYAMWLTLLLCVILPPVGLALLWGRARCPMRGKVWMTILSVAVMVVALTYVLEARNRAAYVIPDAPVAYTYGTATPEPTAVPQTETGTTPAQPPVMDGVIQANPLG